MLNEYDVAVVGAGAAGLMAAIFAGRAGGRVVAIDSARARLPPGWTDANLVRGRIPAMARKLDELFRQASELTENERAELAGLLLESLEAEADEDVEAAWAEEIERRVRQVDSGEAKTIPWEQVRANLYARLNDKR